MYARLTRMTVAPDRIGDVRAQIGDVKVAVSGIPGLKYWFSASDDDSGEGVAIAIYDSKESADAAAGAARDLVASFADFFSEPPEVAEFEIDEFIVS